MKTNTKISSKALEILSQFSKEHAEWIRAGKPIRSKLLMQDIFYNKCQPCDYFQKTWWRYKCTKCQCRLSPRSKKINKLYYATTSCPIGIWHKEGKYTQFHKDQNLFLLIDNMISRLINWVLYK